MKKLSNAWNQKIFPILQQKLKRCDVNSVDNTVPSIHQVALRSNLWSKGYIVHPYYPLKHFLRNYENQFQFQSNGQNHVQYQPENAEIPDSR